MVLGPTWSTSPITNAWYNQSLALHDALGIIVLVLATLKIAWNVLGGTPSHLASLRSWERFAATGAHILLYVAMVLIPATGYLVSTSNGEAVSFFGWFDIPALFAVSDAVRDQAIDLHYYVAYGVAALIIIHGGAALKHHFISKDQTLRRML